jgi:hypothetical protein
VVSRVFTETRKAAREIVLRSVDFMNTGIKVLRG